MKIRTRLLLTLLGISLFAIVGGTVAVERQRHAIELNAAKEAEEVARTLSFQFLAGSNHFTPNPQSIVMDLHRLQKRDVVLLDTHQIILADTMPSNIGGLYHNAPHDETGQTLNDLRPRAFVEGSGGRRTLHLVVPVQASSGKVIGALVLEYTPLYDEMRALNSGSVGEVFLATFGLAAVAFLLAWQVGQSIIRRLDLLTRAALEFADGKTALNLPAAGGDEIGILSEAFRQMVTDREKLEMAQRHHWLTFFFNGAPVGLSLMNQDLRYVNVNDTLAKIHGLNPDQIIGRQIREFAPKLASTVEPILLEVFATGKPVLNVAISGETAHQPGVWRHWLASLLPILDETGKTESIAIMVIEITELRQAENAIRKLSRVVEQSPISVIITDTSGTIEYVNPTFVEMTGYRVDEAIGQNPRLLKSGKHPPGFYQEMWDTLDQGKPWQEEICNKRKSGELYWGLVRISHVRDENGKITHFVGLTMDITGTRQMQEALRGSERQLKAILDNIPDHVWLKDKQSRFLIVNRAWSDFFKVSLDEVIGETGVDLMPSETAKRFKEEDEALLNNGRVVFKETCLIKSGLRAAWFEMSKTALIDEEGFSRGIVGVARDITQRKEAESALIQSKHFLQSTLDSLSAHIAILDERGIIVAVNAAWRQFARQNAFLGSDFGVGANYLTLCETADGDCSSEAPAIAQGIRMVMAGRHPEFSREYPCHSPEEQRWFIVRITRFQNDGPVRVVVAHENITVRKRVEEELKKKTAFLEAQVHSSIDAILVVDSTGRRMLKNEQLQAFFQVPQNIIENDDDEKLLSWATGMVKNPEQFLEKVRFLYSNPGQISRDEIEIKSGTVLDRYSAPVIGKDGEYYGRVWTFRDITDRQRTDRQLILAREAAESASRAKSDFLAMMSHEIRTPMTALLGFADLLRDTTLSEEQGRFVETIQRSGRKLLTLLNDILDLSKIEAGKLTVEIVPFDLAKVVEEVSNLLAAQARQKNLIFSIDPRVKGSLQPLGDPERVRQVLLNLAGNAIKFTSRGSVTIRMSAASAPSGFCRCEVIDTGIGIPEDKLNALFQNFSQADSSTTRRFGGTGLGLAISKRLVELMGGEIGVSSQPGAGSVFWFTLPLSVGSLRGGLIAPAISLPEQVELPAPLQNGLKVLLAEDNAISRKLLLRFLERLHCNVDLAANGAEAVALASRHPYDVILMDCLMPEMDGCEATAEIRRAETSRRTPVIAVTACVTEEQKQKCAAVGMDDFVSKPIHAQTLQEMLAKWTGPSRTRRPELTDS